jgi:hypothetical protein
MRGAASSERSSSRRPATRTPLRAATAVARPANSRMRRDPERGEGGVMVAAGRERRRRDALRARRRWMAAQ